MDAQRKKRKGNPLTHNNSNSLQVILNKSLEPERLIWVLSYLFLWIDWFRWFYLLPLVNGWWSIWSSWTSCNQSCGIGSQERSRNCTRPSPSYGGKPCQGAKREKQMCKKQLRPGRNEIQRIPRILNNLIYLLFLTTLDLYCCCSSQIKDHFCLRFLSVAISWFTPFFLLFNNLYSTYNPLEYSTNWKSGKGLIT